MKILGMILLFLLIPLGCYAEEEEILRNGWGIIEAKEWGAFANDPSQKNYFALGKLISQCEEGNEECEQALNPHYSRSQKIFDLVELGNRKAIDITFASLRLLGGGGLGDAMRSLGVIIETDPEFFLREVRSHGLSLVAIRSIAEKNPLVLADQFNLQIKALQKRLKSMSTLQVKDPFLSFYKDEIEKIILKRIEFLKKILANEDVAP